MHDDQFPFGGPIPGFGNMRLGDPELLAFEGILPPMIQQLLGGNTTPHSKIHMDDHSFHIVFRVKHPIFGIIDITGTENDVLRGIAAIIAEISVHHDEQQHVFIDAIQAREDAAARTTGNRIISRLRRQELPPDDTTVELLDREIRNIRTVYETLIMGLYFVERGYADGVFFDQLVVNLGVADMLGHPIDPVVHSTIEDIGTTDAPSPDARVEEPVSADA